MELYRKCSLVGGDTLRITNTEFWTNLIEKVAKIVKIPNIGWKRYMGAIRNPGPI